MNNLDTEYYHNIIEVSRIGHRPKETIMVPNDIRKEIEDYGFNYSDIFKMGFARTRYLVGMQKEYDDSSLTSWEET